MNKVDKNITLVEGKYNVIYILVKGCVQSNQGFDILIDRFMTEDTKELLFRAEVQNRVYKRQIETIDVEIWRLENLLYSTQNSQTSLASNNVLKVR